MDFSGAERRHSVASSIYNYLYRSTSFCSRQSLARELGLSMPTVYQNLSKLMELGLVCESGEQLSTGGRKVSGLSIVPQVRTAVGISVTEHYLRFVASDLLLNELAYRQLSINAGVIFSGSGKLLSESLERFLDDSGIDRERLLGVGIAIPAVMSPDVRHITAAPTLHLRDTSLEGLAGHIPYPTYIENDATCGGYAEWFERSGVGDMAYLSLENGVGGAILFDGRPYLGNNRRSAEFGHMCVEPGGLTCTCGKQGCLESYCSPRRIQNTFGVTPEDFFSTIERHGPGYQEYSALWENMLRHLAIGISNIRMALDCDVVIGGRLREFLPPYLPRLKEYVSGIDPFGSGADYLQLSALRRHAVPLGVALHFVVDFINQI